MTLSRKKFVLCQIVAKGLQSAILSLMGKIKRICVFTGSTCGERPEYREDALKLAKILTDNSIALVYGGGNRGIMGILANEVKRLGGKVTGVLPKAMDLPSVRSADVETELIIVNNMHERKEKMYELADAFSALPGGIGTLEELSEIFTWRQLGYHKKNIAILNSTGYYDHLLEFLKKMVSEGFMNAKVLEELIVIENVNDTLALLKRSAKDLPSKL